MEKLFKRGDVVKRDNVLMTVNFYHKLTRPYTDFEILTGFVNCIWFEKSKLKFGRFHKDNLILLK